MPVSEEVRRVEAEIDYTIRNLPIWRAPRDRLLRVFLDFYRDAIEVMFLGASHALQFGNPFEFECSLALERDLHAGMLQVLKWAMELCNLKAKGELPAPEEILNVIELGTHYEVFVDALKMANHGRTEIDVDIATRTVTVFEGGNRTGFDDQLVSFQHQTLPLKAQTPIVEDGDRLTSRWSAGDFRKATKALAELAKQAETEPIVSGMGGGIVPLITRPAVFEVPRRIYDAHKAVFDDITLDAVKVGGETKWKLTAWLDIPLTLMGASVFAVSNLVKALGGRAGDDYMLRIAARVDPVQYSKATELRHKRMIEACKKMLLGWDAKGPVLLTSPALELDVYATRAEASLILQIKSTLRPETPWEVLKRNEDIIDGIKHTSNALTRIRSGSFGFLITDGYRGDYQTWEVANRLCNPIGTVEDVREIATDPAAALNLLKARAGFNTAEPGGPVPDRAFELLEWKFRLIDAPGPELSRTAHA
jgi:hypothetical protein